jgi:hypothetical protein
MLGILVGGNLLATVLALRGETVLHASAVEIDGRAIAFVARSGTGKSTLAALACARGARFVTDDLLRLAHDGESRVRCWPGAPENRLRRGFGEIVGGLADPAAEITRLSVDGRVVWRPAEPAGGMPVLDAIVLPSVAPDNARLCVRPVPADIAVLELTRRPRLLGLIDAGLRAREFANLSRLVRSVPVFAADVPWGPPFDPDVIDELLALSRPTARRGTPTPAV